MKNRYVDYPQLHTEWTQRQCTLGKALPLRLVIYTTEPTFTCVVGQDGYGPMANPYLVKPRDFFVTGYWPIVSYRTQGVLRLKKGLVNVMTNPNTNHINSFGSQHETTYYCCVIDLSSERVVDSGEIAEWSILSPGDVYLIFHVGTTPMNYHNLIDQAISSPKPIGVEFPS